MSSYFKSFLYKSIKEPFSLIISFIFVLKKSAICSIKMELETFILGSNFLVYICFWVILK
jgi:hypothetical protein